METLESHATMEIHDGTDILWQLAAIRSIDDKDGGFAAYNQRTRTVEIDIDAGEATYTRRLAVLRDPNLEFIDGEELRALGTDFVKLSIDGTMKPYADRLQSLFEEMSIAALNNFLEPTHVIKVRAEHGIETWAALNSEDLIGFVNSSGKKALASSGPIVIGTIATDAAVQTIMDNMKSVHGDSK